MVPEEKAEMTVEEYEEFKYIANFVYKKYYFKYKELKDDLIASGFSYMWKYLKKWDATKSNRITYLCLCCRSGMSEFLRKEYLLYRKNNKLNTSEISLSTPVGEDGEDCLSDIIVNDKNPLEEKMRFENLKSLIFETLESMKEYTAQGKLKNPNLYNIIPLYIKYQKIVTVADKLGLSRQFVQSCVSKFRERLKEKLKEVDYFG